MSDATCKTLGIQAYVNGVAATLFATLRGRVSLKCQRAFQLTDQIARIRRLNLSYVVRLYPKLVFVRSLLATKVVRRGTCRD